MVKVRNEGQQERDAVHVRYIYVYRKAVKVKVKTAVRPAMMFSLETVALSNGQSAELEVKGTKMLGAVWR